MLQLVKSSLLIVGALLIVGGFGMSVVAGENERSSQIVDVCANCHSTAPTPRNHIPMPSASVNGCLNCHTTTPGEKFMVRVHERHLAMSMQCGTCHAGTPPQRSALDVLLRASGGTGNQ